jgi:hypothetical protein
MLISFLRSAMLHTEDDGVTATGVTPDAVAEPPVAAPAVPDNDTLAELERVRTALKAANKEAADRRKRLDALEAAEKERQQAEMTELDKTKAELDALKAANATAQASLRRAALKEAAGDAAQKAGLAFAPGALADAVLLGAFDDLEVGDDGGVAGMTDAVKALHKQRPHFFAPALPEKPEINSGARGNGKNAPPTTTGVVRF